jgi:hypothetical protein
VYFIGSHDLFHSEHGYARLGETIVILQMAPPELWSWAHSLHTLVNICNVFWPSDALMTSHIRGHLL